MYYVHYVHYVYYVLRATHCVLRTAYSVLCTMPLRAPMGLRVWVDGTELARRLSVAGRRAPAHPRDHRLSQGRSRADPCSVCRS